MEAACITARLAAGAREPTSLENSGRERVSLNTRRVYGNQEPYDSRSDPVDCAAPHRIAVEAKEVDDPASVRRLRAWGVVLGAAHLANLLQQFHCCRMARHDTDVICEAKRDDRIVRMSPSHGTSAVALSCTAAS